MAVRDVIQAAAGVGGGDKLYVEDVFSTYLYTGNGTSQTITNGIDLAGEGGLVWIKSRSTIPSSQAHMLADTERGPTVTLGTDDTAGNASDTDRYDSFNSDGFSIKSSARVNYSSNPYASWTFRKAPKFFDVVTWTGDGVAGRQIAHNLDSVPGMVIVKDTSADNAWYVWHRGLTSGNYIILNATAAQSSSYAPNFFGNGTTTVDPTSTYFTVGGFSDVNASGRTYVAYIFAHDAGGFGDDGEQNVISCGSYTGNGSATGPVIDLGYEPQWLLIKRASSLTGNWIIQDVMRGMSETNCNLLFPNNSNAEQVNSVGLAVPTSTGFKIVTTSSAYNSSGVDYIYIAIRRPMKTPESGTEVFAVDRGDGTTTNPQFRSGFVTDFALFRNILAGNNWETTSRLQGSRYMRTNLTSAEAPDGDIDWDFMNGFYGPVRNTNFYSWMFRRAPGFMDVVAYTGNGTAGRTVVHNLGVAPELMIVKDRNNGGVWGWSVYHKDIGNDYKLQLEAANAKSGPSSSYWNNTNPQATLFTLGDISTNWNGTTYIAYLFASLPGVSKVGSYSGTGATQTINCGFSAGARFVLIKRTDSTGDWYLWDSVRGIVAGNDPYLLLNSTAAEVTSTDYIDPVASGFEISSSAPAAINASGGTFIYLAIA